MAEIRILFLRDDYESGYAEMRLPLDDGPGVFIDDGLDGKGSVTIKSQDGTKLNWQGFYVVPESTRE